MGYLHPQRAEEHTRRAEGDGRDRASPVGYIGLRTNGDKVWFGWPDNAAIEKDIAAWYDAKTLDEEKAIIAGVNRGSGDRRRCEGAPLRGAHAAGGVLVSPSLLARADAVIE
jgi:hypothetical protein